ncbi:MAG: rRNA maturation RNase YbeY [Desulfovibrio sp.]|nr:rRNA maturation RNase YbeY [Desulfovibrio sp.]
MIQIHYLYKAPWIIPFTKTELHPLLETMLEAALRSHIGRLTSEIELYLVDDNTIRELNLRHLHAFGPTNILSFPGGEGLSSVLVLSLDTFARECHLYGQRPKSYFLTLLAHGMAHLAELDHGLQHDKIQSLCLHSINASFTDT